MNILEKEAAFEVNIVGDKTNQTYLGSFRVKCILSPLEQIAADRRYRELLGANSHLAAQSVREQAFALAELEQRVIESPPFWQNETIGGGHIEDVNVIMEVLDNAVEAQLTYVKTKKIELKERQDKLTELIKNKKIEKEPEIENINEKSENEENEVEI